MSNFEEIYKEYFHLIHSFILSISNDPDIADDITQDTFYKAMKSLKSFRGECDIRTWLCRIAKNSYLTYCRRNNKYVSAEKIPEQTEYSYSIAEKLTDKEAADRIYYLLHNMPEPYKEVFSLRVFGELSFKKIGNLFNKTENWACVTYYRAKSFIQKEMEEQNEN